jgi:hypothetical protein
MLRVRSLDESAKDRRFEMYEVGTAFHDLLEKVVEDLAEDGWFDGSRDAAKALAAARERVDARWKETVERIGSRMRKHLPGLWAGEAEVWREEIQLFLAKDLERLIANGHRLKTVEKTWADRVLNLGAGAALLREAGFAELAEDSSMLATGRLDRVTHDADDRYWVSDYKTAGNLKGNVTETNNLTGDRLQGPFYAVLAEAEIGKATVEFLGLGPYYRPDKGYARDKAYRLTPGDFDKYRAHFEETLLVLVGMARTGRFPFHEAHRCLYCDYQDACRRFHHASKERITTTPLYEVYRLTTEKGSKKGKSLREVREKQS